jgi:peptidyl-prolyl cis-trans isomerase A (cyclophilin A)
MSDGEIGRRGVLSGAGLLLATPGLVVAQAKPQVAITTDKGVITLTLEPGKAPVTTANFLRYVAAAKYDGGQFFRAARTKGAPQLGSIVASPNLRAQPYPAIGTSRPPRRACGTRREPYRWAGSRPARRAATSSSAPATCPIWTLIQRLRATTWASRLSARW